MATPHGTCTSCHTPLPADAQFCPRCGAATPTEISAGGTATLTAPAPDKNEQQRRVQAAIGPDYEVQRSIGSGGFAEVWAAFDKKLERSVAVKVMHPELVASRSMMERFQREARAVAKLRHPGIVPIYAVGEHEGLAYYIMPLVEGESLRDRLTREGALPPAEVGRILREAAAALAVAHKAGIVHRDIKPENLMLEGEERRVLLMDFGIAKSTGGTQTGLTGTGMIVGTPTYMSPEQASGSKEVDVRSDIYSLGVVAFELLSGKPPFHATSVPELLLQHVSTPAPSVAAGRSDIRQDLAIAVNRCLAKEPGERWRDAAELSAFLSILGTPVSQPAPVPQGLLKYAQPLPVWSRPLGVLASQARARVVDAMRRVRRVRRWQALAVAAVALAGYLTLFGQRSAREAWEVVASWLHPAPIATPSVPSELSWIGGGGRDAAVRVVPLADTALGVMTQARGLAFMDVFNGDHWSRVPGLPDRTDFVPVTARGDVWLLPKTPGSYYRLSGSRFVREDSCPIGVWSAWSDGEVIVAQGPGGLAVRAGGTWRRLPTGRKVMGKLMGRARDSLYAIGSLGMEPEGRTDSLLEFDGFTWHSLDPRPDRSRLWFYNDGIARRNGGYLVVGLSETPDGVRTALILEHRPNQTAWVRKDVNWGRWQPSELHRVREAAGSVFVWWMGSGIWEIVGDRAALVEALRSRTILDVVAMRGRPYVVTDDGLVWTREKGEWAAVAAVPGSGEIGAAISGRQTVAEFPELLPSFAPIGASGLSSVRRVAVVDSVTYWILGQDGRVAHVSCLARVCENTPVTSPASARDTVLNLSIVPGWGVMATGTNDLVSTWTGRRWRGELVAGTGPTQAFVRVTGDSTGAVVLLGRRSVLRLARGGRRQILGTLPEGFGPPIDIAAGPMGQVVVLGATGLAIWSPAAGLRYDPAFPANLYPGQVPTAVTFLPDGRVLVATANPDPLLGGRLLVRAVSGPWVGLAEPSRSNLVGFFRNAAGVVHVAATGWQALRVMTGNLPFAPP